ncbi:mRNA-degrading endonuclease [Paenibacillus agaridevorans]|uniref:mRNA-degrading endonuclease n=1 Tax=Paenibacillus agaridevorans TaxID=171404 RepID=A0A2R5EQU0_9BACL|nr:type II toxin-antitoxin system PemK/MazF family toxin [Paenibacillus agaridevorans]GBG08029.1 mRNA-degrading endonuclease [Paenibacillus agaridevorans]
MSADRGDLVWINFNPQTGHEQAGRRSAIVLSPKSFNDTTGFVSVCPITHTVRGWGYEVMLPEELVFNGVILTDQVKNLDWRARRIDVVGRAPDEVVNECLDKIRTFL